MAEWPGTEVNKAPEVAWPGRETSNFPGVEISTPEFDIAKGGAGFVESFTRDPEKFAPIFGSLHQAGEMANIVESARRLDRDDYENEPVSTSVQLLTSSPYSFVSGQALSSPAYRVQKGEITQREADLEVVTNWWNELQEQKERGYTTGGTIGLIVGEMPAYMAEFALTGGMAKAGEKATTKFLGKFLKDRLGTKIATKLLGKFAGAGVRTPLMMNRVAKAYMENRLPKNVQLNNGELTFEFSKDKPFTSFLKAYGDTFAEAFSEELGEFIKLPFGKKLSEKMWKVFKIKHPKLSKVAFLKRLSTRTGFHGIVGELGEEFAGDALRAVINIQDFGAGEDADIKERLQAALKQDWQNKWIMAASFAVPAAVRGTAMVGAFGLENVTGEPFSIDDIVSRAKAQETIDAKMEKAKNDYLKKAVRPGVPFEAQPEMKILEIEEGVEPGQLFEVPPEKPEEIPVIADQVDIDVLKQTQELMDQGMEAHKAFQWARKMIPTKPKPNVPEQAPVSPTERKPSPQKRKRIEVIRSERKERFQTLVNTAKKLSDESGMPLSQALEVVKQIRNEQETAAAPGEILKTQLGKRNRAILRIASGSREVYDETMAYIESTGGLVDDPRLLNTQLNVFRSMAAQRRKQRNKQVKANMKDKSVNILSAVQPIRYALSKLELASGFPLRAIYRKMNIKHNHTRTEIENLIRGVYAAIGETPESLTISTEQNNAIKNWLFEKNQKSYDSLPATLKNLAQQLDNLLQTEGAQRVRSIRWKWWKKYGIVPTGIPKGQNPDDILREGQLAEQEGRLREWLTRQVWGARETYYMTEGREDAVDTLIQMLKPGTLRDNASAAQPGVVPGEAKTRVGKGEYKKGFVLNNVHTHLTRLALADELMDDIDIFWSGFNNANPSSSDVDDMKNFITHLVGKAITGNKKLTTAFRQIRGGFWNIYFLDPFRSSWFFFRNKLQNMAYLPSQIGLGEVYRSSKSLVKQWKNSSQNQERVEDFAEVWQDDINQKKKIYQEAVLAREETTSFEQRNKEVLNKARHVADAMASWALHSDTWNRIEAWNMYYDAAQRNFDQFQNGKIGDAVMRNRLKLDTLDVTQVNEILQELSTGNTRNATKLYASYKTENTHFRYETTLRSAIEQIPINRALVGLLVYPRGVFNLAYQNGAKPLAMGIKTGDYDKAWQGLTSLLSLAIFSSLTREFLKKVTGRDNYGIPTYAPLDPGVSLIMNMADAVRGAKTKGVSRTVKILAANLEFGIPLAKTYVDMYESQNDKAGVKFWQLVAISLEGRYKRKYKKTWKKNNRSDWEKISHVLFSGGFETEEE